MPSVVLSIPPGAETQYQIPQEEIVLNRGEKKVTTPLRGVKIDTPPGPPGDVHFRSPMFA